MARTGPGIVATMATFDLYAELGAVTAALDASQIEHAICGALALAVHGYPRATKDIDVLLDPSRIADAKRVLSALGYTLPAAPMSFQSGLTVHRVSRVEGRQLITVDLIAPDRADLATVLTTREHLAWQDRRVSVVSRAGLITMKRLAGRPQDLADLVALGEGGEDA